MVGKRLFIRERYRPAIHSDAKPIRLLVFELPVSVEKSIYDPKSRSDGFRVLVMQYWPRGVKKTKVDVWFKDLGTDKQLIKSWKKGRVSWVEFRKRYLASLKDLRRQEIIRDLVKRARTQEIMLLCACRDPQTCHRILLKEEIEKLV